MNIKFKLMFLSLAVFIISATILCIGSEAQKVVSSPEKPVDMRAFFNGEEATVLNVTLQVGEEFSIELYIQSNIDLEYLLLLVNEPGEVASYKILDGESHVELYDVEEGSSLYYHWKLVTCDNWAGGRAPLQLSYSFKPADYNGYVDSAVCGTFSFACPYIEA